MHEEALSMELEGEESPSESVRYVYPEHDHVLSYVDDGEWRKQALCRSMDKVYFFGSGLVGDSWRTTNFKKEAIQLCKECPVKMDCLKFAVLNNQEYGVWGGYDMQTMRMPERRALYQRLNK